MRVKLYGNGEEDALFVTPGVSRMDDQNDLVAFTVGGTHEWIAISYDDLLRISDAATKARGRQAVLGEAEGVVVTLRDNALGSVDVTLQFQGEAAEQVRNHLHLLQRVGVKFIAEVTHGAVADADRAG